MPSLDGYSLNEKMDRLHNEVSQEINDLQMKFNSLYSYLKAIEDKEPKKKEVKNAKGSKNRK